MLKLLVKKHFAEVFKNYFYNSKKNRMRSKASIAGMFILFIFLMVGVMGGIFTVLSLSLCEPLTDAGAGWLYFVLMGSLAILLGAFGSVFNTYAGLYRAKDNDLLLSMPIPVRVIVAARLLNVYLLGVMYSATALLPTLIVYWIIAGFTVPRLIGGLAFILIVTVIVLILSCVLGFVVAKISLKIRHKSFVTVLLSLAFFGLYYFCYFKASGFIRDLILNADEYGEKIKGISYGLYLFGRVGEGDLKAAVISLAVTAAVLALIGFILIRSFLGIATSNGKTVKVRYVEKEVRRRSAFRAFLGKELLRFTSSSNYILNCGLGILFILAGAVFLLIEGREILETLNEVFVNRPGSPAALLSSMLCLLSTMNDMAAPSVSLEGKNLWIPQSLPIEPKTVLRAKAALQLILTGIPMLAASVCAAIVLPAPLPEKLAVCVMPLMFAAFMAVFDTMLSVRLPMFSWTSEIVPIKQGGAIALALFGGWLFCLIPVGIYLIVGFKIGAAPYLFLCAAFLAFLSWSLLKWLDTKGAAAFSSL